MTPEDLSLLISRICTSAGMPRAEFKRRYFTVIKRLVRAGFNEEDIFVMVRALAENHYEYKQWVHKRTKPSAMSGIKRILRRLGGT
jgi:uncharacterized protein (DUF2336 family)